MIDYQCLSERTKEVISDSFIFLSAGAGKWKDINGTVHELSQMKTNYLKNALKTIGKPETTSFANRHEDDILIIRKMLKEKINEINKELKKRD